MALSVCQRGALGSHVVGAKTASGQMNPSPAQVQRHVETDWKAEGQLVQMLACH